MRAAASRVDWPRRLLAWYRVHRRDLPWRRNGHPYAILVSEFMLQQTRVTTAIPYFENFMRRFPTLDALAAATEQDVLRCWEGLGYYSRARHLHRAAQAVRDQYGGRIPSSYDGLLDLPGIGPYTAAAIASIAFQTPKPAVDGNVLRVAARFWGIEDDIMRTPTRTTIGARLEAAIPARSPGDFNQAMMELGAVICRPTGPRCDRCPLSAFCRALALGRTSELPIRRTRVSRPEIVVAVGAVTRRGRLLVVRRPSDAMLGGLWELPGGRVTDADTAHQRVRSEVLREAGVRVTPGDASFHVKHAYSHFRVVIEVRPCRDRGGRLRSRPGARARWADAGQLADLPFSAASRRILEGLRRHGLLPRSFV